jgi:predicted  nucleic acid-binding Zn-ribbon protein
MKKLLLLTMIVPVLISCNQKKIKQLETKNDSLVEVSYSKDSSLDEFLVAFNEIQDNLDSIKAKELLINERTSGKTELRKNAKDQINDDVNAIYDLLVENKNKVNELSKKLGKANYQVKELKKMIDHLTNRMEQKDKEIEVLLVELESLNIKIGYLSKDVTRLNVENETKDGIIGEQKGEIGAKTIELNTAYYIVGNKKKLKEMNVLTSEGGFIGLGKSKKLNSDFNDENFIKIDIRKTTTISIPGKKPNVITSHPAVSYEISGEGDEQIVTITNYEEFWKTSKYLVIIIQ